MSAIERFQQPVNSPEIYFDVEMFEIEEN